MLYAFLIIVLVVACWIAAQEKPLLHVKFKGGVIVWSKGHFPQMFKHNVIEIGEIVPFDGEIKVFQRRSGPEIKFSHIIPQKVKQRISNVFPHQGFISDGEDRKKG
ncbi:DUF3634 family protein [Vibrio marisflavi]|uniref:Uncharacterized protein n=1 Tax=Vibrio marisflavi CECT 7928 TaxID=634439 RepID=A0ABM9A4H0_9VIBR|nr:DUF3634 family protein [Vibrio marisflavi]CAH0539788.1 hypothetical protein VMF7928_02445 [Vibrio marisflavi CECT 7928]